MSLAKIAKSFTKGALSYDKVCFVHQQSALHFIPRLQRYIQAPKTILDVGCGTGLIGSYLKQAYPEAKLTGIDIAEGMIQQASCKQIYDTLIVQNALEHKKQYDLIIAHFSLQWFNDLDKAILHLSKYCQFLAFVVPISTSFSSWKMLYPHSCYPLPDLGAFDSFLPQQVYKHGQSYPMTFAKASEFAKYLRALGANFTKQPSMKMMPKNLFADSCFTTSYEVIEVIMKGAL